jgi:hypothetical protein
VDLDEVTGEIVVVSGEGLHITLFSQLHILSASSNKRPSGHE